MAALERGHQDPGAERLGQQERVAGTHADIADNPARIDYAGHRHAVFDLFIGHAMAADDRDTGLARFRCAAAQDFTEHRAGQSGLRPADDIQRGLGRAAHRVDVGQRVGRGDCAVGERIVDDRREEIDRVDDRQIVAQTEHSGVVAGSDTDEQVGMSPEIKCREH